MSNTRDLFLQPCEVKTEKVSVPVKGAPVWVRRLPLRLRDMFEDLVAKRDAEEITSSEFMAQMVALIMCDEQGEPILDYEDQEHIDALRNQDPEELMPVFTEGLKLNAIDADAEIEAEAEKSEGAPD